MARTINQIQQQIITEKNTHTELSGLNSPSQTSIWVLWTYIMAVAIYVQEGLWDIFQSNLETQIANTPAWTDAWVHSQTFKFQYDSTNPQVLQFDSNFVPTYPVVDTTKQIITRASVKTLPTKIVSVKVAKSNPPQALSAPELTSFKGYLDNISPAGVQYKAVSLNPDQILIGATIYYNGQYSATIQSAVKNAINNYLANVPFDGVIKISAIEDTIQSVAGVTDVVMNNVAIRADGVPFANTTYLVQNNTEIYNQTTQYAGYSITETTTGYTINDTLTFVIS